MNKRSKRRIGRRLVVAIVGAAAVCALFRFPSSNETRLDPSASKHSSSVLSAGPTGREEVATPQGNPLRRDEKFATQTSAVSETAPAEIHAVFPNVAGRISDWRDFRPERITVAPHDDLPITFTRTAVRVEGRYVTWVGRNDQMPGASFVGVATEAGYDAILVVPFGAQFSYHVRGERVVIEEVDPSGETCGNFAMTPLGDADRVAADTLLGITYAPGYEPLPDMHAETASLRSDVLIAYDAGTLAAAAAKSSDPAGYIDGQCKAMVETSNLALGRSGVTAFSWRYLGAVAAPAYTQTGKSLDDIKALIPGGALASWVTQIRYERGVDQLLLLTAESDFGGRAYSPQQKAVTREYAVAVMHWGRSFLTLAHELAHNFGCNHDRAHINGTDSDEIAPAVDGDGFWNYGQLWTNPVGNASSAGTIMSYADWRIPYFSNPNVSVHVTGEQLGWSSNPDLGTHQTGRVETDPKAAYNVRVLNEQAAAMSAISDEIAMPAIEQSPESMTIVRGRTFTLTVKATGGGLSYQWFKDGAALAGIHGASYSKISENGDAGGYHVVVSNYAGKATSATATVSVTAPAAPPPAPVAGSGGGGAPSGWFVGVLGLCMCVRWLSGRWHR